MGSSWDGEGTNFAVFSANATKVEVCLFDNAGEREIDRIALPEYTDLVWHGCFVEIPPGTHYGLRVTGPYEPESGHRFNPNKLLLDPYARAHIGAFKWDPALFGYRMESGDDLTFDDRDSAPFMPKCLVADRPSGAVHPQNFHRVPWDDTLLYELHVGGYTKLHPDVPGRLRGKYRGLATKEVIQYIRSLGVTSVELLPVQSFVSAHHLMERGLCNFWGYDTIGFFAPDQRYAVAPEAVLREFKEMVERFHEAGLEVILDVVYNHTAEGNELGPTLSFKGIDNANYYRLVPDQQRFYLNYSGTGNAVNLHHPFVVQMVMDSLRYWVQETRVDGFRFDLATTLARDENGFNHWSGFFKTCSQDPVLAKIKLIAEPWDLGPNGYQVGGFPPGWAEWNDKFRDAVRDFWRCQTTISNLVPRLCASAEQFNHEGRRPWASVNFVTSHDGFTLYDSVSYNERHNQANGENNQDGTADNHSWNCGVEGPTEDPAILELRQRQMRNLLATLLLAQGTPMLLAGDEFARTQNGNNNAYCQDNEISWVDWNLRAKNGKLLQFVRDLAELRHKHPILRRNTFLTGERVGRSIRDVTWIHPRGYPMQEKHWHDAAMRCFGMLLDGRAHIMNGIPQRGQKATLLIVFNGCPGRTDFTLPTAGRGNWLRLLDTNLGEMQPSPPLKPGTNYAAEGHSLVLFQFSKVGAE
ncbi:MAG: glycogen debranching protein GlgX [Bryobacterales bacterium]|nr:glycogen debranching protein GlgX [Bryobacterales bacterium]